MRLDEENLKRVENLLLEDFNYIMGVDEFNNLVEMILDKYDSLKEDYDEYKKDVSENYRYLGEKEYEYGY